MAKEIQTLFDLLNRQNDFQIMTGNSVPNGYVSFENVQTSLAHNVYQMVEWQEFMEASVEDRQEELIDYLLFTINKYLYLGILLNDSIGDQSLNGTLWSSSSYSSICQCDNLARLEQNDYITFIRDYCQFKPWKCQKSKHCSDKMEAWHTFMMALDNFRQISNIVFKDYESFYAVLSKKLSINVNRQECNY